jgi:hypothetical protein
VTADGFDGAGGRGPRPPHRSARPLWPMGVPDPEPGEPDLFSAAEAAAGERASQQVALGVEEEPDLGEIVVILLVSTLAGLRDRLERDGYYPAAALVHDLVEVADDFITHFQP